MIRLRAGWATDAGRLRTTNQDRVAVVDGRLFAVADGMGGHRGGETAAQIAADTMAAYGTTAPVEVSGRDLVEQLQSINRTILQASQTTDELYGMGTTLTMVVASTRHDGSGATPLLHVVNIGDSRTYRLQSGELEQLTEDHSVVGELLRDGRITEEEAKTHRQRSVITRALGVDHAVQPDVLEIIATPGTRYLLCSDGLPNEVPDNVLGSVLRRIADPTEAARELVRLALERGGRDNVSVVVVDVFDDTGIDAQALAASAAVRTTAAPTQQILDEDDPTGVLAAPRATDQRADDRRADQMITPRVKRPWPINLRVILFLAIVAALATAVWMIVKAAPEDTTPTTVPTTTASTFGPVPTTDYFAPAESTTATTPTTATGPAPTTTPTTPAPTTTTPTTPAPTSTAL